MPTSAILHSMGLRQKHHSSLKPGSLPQIIFISLNQGIGQKMVMHDILILPLDSAHVHTHSTHIYVHCPQVAIHITYTQIMNVNIVLNMLSQ